MKKVLSSGNLIRLIVAIIGVITLLWFLLPFMVAGILNIGNITGIVLATLLVGYMLFMPMVHEWIKDIWNKCKRGRFLIKVCVAVAATIILLATIETGCMISSCIKAPVKGATAVVLGCRVYGERASLSLVERLQAAKEYLEENPEAMCVVSGGQGPGEDISESECMYRWLVANGIDGKRIYKEDKSTSTDENIAFSKEVIKENELNPNIAIITSEYHTYRATLIAKDHGLSYGSAPGTTAIWLFPTYYMRELYAILAEWVLN